MNDQRNNDKSGNNYGPRILVVDDDPSIREIMKVILEDNGYQPVCAKDAEEAIEVFYKDPFPVVFADMRMPGMDGIELTKKIRQTHNETQVVIMTAHASLDSSIRALRTGAYDYLIKTANDYNAVLPILERALDKVRLVVENRYLLEQLRQSNVELGAANQALCDITLKDGLTGLYNQRYMKEIINIELNRSRRHNRVFSVLFCDIDYFKRFNDSNGHLLGDKALEDFSRLVLNRLRLTDFASRYGGEEFVFLLPETSKAHAGVLANELRQLISDNHFEGKESQPGNKLTVSIGISAFPEDGDNEGALLDAADKALYRAKSNGRNQVCLYEK